MSIYKYLKDLKNRIVNVISDAFPKQEDEDDLLPLMDDTAIDNKVRASLSPKAAQIFQSKYGEFTPDDLSFVRPADMQPQSDNPSSGIFPNPKYVYRSTVNPNTAPIGDIEGLEPITSTKLARKKAFEINPGVYSHRCGLNVGLSTTFNKADALNVYGQTTVEGGVYYPKVRAEFKNAVTWIATYKVSPNAVILNSNDYQSFMDEWKRRHGPNANKEAAQYLQGIGYDGVKKFGNSPEIQWLSPAESLKLKSLKRQGTTREQHPAPEV